MERVILLLGGNIGDVEQTLEQAAEMLEREVGRIYGRSTMMRSEAWGFGSERVEPFTNQAIVIETRLEAEELLDATQSIERQLGRDRAEEQRTKMRRGVTYLSRAIDIDIIFYGDKLINTPRLCTPHALMAEREFVLAPIAEVAPEWRHPLLGATCGELLRRLRDR